MPFNVGHFCGYLSHKWARKLVSGKRKRWISNYGAAMNFKAAAGRLCAAVLAGEKCCCARGLLQQLAAVAPVSAPSWLFSSLHCFCLL